MLGLCDGFRHAGWVSNRTLHVLLSMRRAAADCGGTERLLCCERLPLLPHEPGPGGLVLPGWYYQITLLLQSYMHYSVMAAGQHGVCHYSVLPLFLVSAHTSVGACLRRGWVVKASPAHPIWRILRHCPFATALPLPCLTMTRSSQSCRGNCCCAPACIASTCKDICDAGQAQVL